MLRGRQTRANMTQSTVYRVPEVRKSIGDGRLLRASPRVLCISGYVQDASPRAALASETSAFVSKPFTPELLTDRVREILATAEAETA